MYRSRVVKDASANIPWEDQQAKIIELGEDPSVNFVVSTAMPDNTVVYLRTWSTVESADAWVAWSLSHPGVVSGTVEEVI
jgi:hypothetical protein